MKKDPYNLDKRYLNWKEKALTKGIEGLSECNSNILIKFLSHMELGINIGVGSKKGARSYVRLMSLRDKMSFIIKKLRDINNIGDITNAEEEHVHNLFTSMQKGTVVKSNGDRYKRVSDYVKVFKTFWHWHQKINKKNNIEIRDITKDLDITDEKPDWVYLTEVEVKRLTENAKQDYKVLIWFLFDTGIRAPTELMNVKVSDFHKDFKELQIREETVKGGSFGRKIKLMLCSDLIKEYIELTKAKADDFLFTKSPAMINKYLKRLGAKVLGDKISPGGQKYSDLTMYDFRHCSCCYWLPRYKSESALKYRFGWKGSDKIHYYSELLGMKDTISEEDMLVDITKTELEQKYQKSEKEKEILQERLKILEGEISQVRNFALQMKKEVFDILKSNGI